MKQRNEEIISFIFSDKSKSIHRREYFKNDFLSFCFYYFPGEFNHPLSPLHFQYVETLEDGTDVYIVTFREFAKTMFLTHYYIWLIQYAKKRFIVHYNSEYDQAKAMLRDVISILQTNEKLIADYGFAYIPEEGIKKSKGQQKTISEFVSETGVKVKAMSIGKSPRGLKFVWKGITYRPDVVAFDDIDTNKNTTNSEIVQKDFLFITGEVFGGTAPFTQKIFLGNVINQDGRVPKLKTHFESDKKNKIKIFWIPIRINGKITWDRFVATDEEADKKNAGLENDRDKFISLETKRRDQGTIGYNQNFNLIAYKKGQKIIKESDIKHYGKLPNNYKIVFGIDPAFSEKTGSDSIGLTITAQEKYEKEIYKYVIEIREFIEEEKDEERFCNVVADLYQKYKCSMIFIENNNGGGILARMLKKRRMAVTVINAEKDKVTRLREYQGEFERGMIKFNPDDSKVGKGIAQIVNFPNVDHDDMMDATVYSFTPFGGGIIKSF